MDLRCVGLGQHALDTIDDRRRAIASLLRDIKHLDPERRQQITAAVVEAGGNCSAPQLMMEPRQVRRLRTLGMDVGAHTVTHPILRRLDDRAADAEIVRSKAELEEILGEPVQVFAYPNGVPGVDYGAEHVAMVRNCGFTAAVSTAWGAASMRSDRFQLPRFTPWDRSRWRYGARLLTNLGRAERQAA